MKKLLAAGLAIFVLAGCSSTSDSSSSSSASGTTNSATVATDDGEVTASVTKEDGKITKVSIDQIQDNESKKDLGDDYGLKAASGIGKEWNEQIEYLENYIVEHGVDAVKLDSEGYAEEEDLLAGCTINLKTIMEAVDEAAAE